MSKHTPGPWSVGDVKTLVISRAQRVLAHTDVDPDIPQEECRANARLIAAAPDLLKAANFAASELASLQPDGHCLSQLLAAIAKAEGRS